MLHTSLANPGLVQGAEALALKKWLLPGQLLLIVYRTSLPPVLKGGGAADSRQMTAGLKGGRNLSSRVVVFVDSSKCTVVIRRVEVFSRTSADYAARAAVPSPRTRHRILTIIPSRSNGKPLFKVSEYCSVPRVREGAAVLDELQRLTSLARQFRKGDPFEIGLGRAERECASNHQPSGDQEAHHDKHVCLGLPYFNLGFDFLTQANMQFPQLLFVDRRRCIGEQALGALGLGECDNVANRLCAGHHGDNPV